MNYRTTLVSLGLTLFLVGGLWQLPAIYIETYGTEMERSALAQQSNLGQVLPITAEAIISGETIDLEVAKTAQEQALGLMYRTSLADDRGMLFPFNPPRPLRFWMKNCKIPLDMVFIRDAVVRAIVANAPPCTAAPCPTYGTDVPVNQVVELRGGRAAELGLEVGDRVSIKFLEGHQGDRPKPQ